MNGDALMFKLAAQMLAGLEGKPLAAGQDMENYEMFDKGVEHPGSSQDVVDAIGRDFEDAVRANPDAYAPQ